MDQNENETNQVSETLTLTGVPMAKAGEQVEITRVPIKKIKLSRNSRMDIAEEELYGLMQSIKEVGLLQPIGLIKKGPHFEIAYGNRRFLACSKLGLHAIPAIVRSPKREFDVDIQNLTENVQRRNLGLAEVGRYIQLLEKEGLTPRECAVRLGVPPTYVNACIDAFQKVPAKFRDDIEVRVTTAQKGKQQEVGKISVRQAQAIVSAGKTYVLNKSETESLYNSAKKLGPKFKPEKVKDYVAAMRQGKSVSEEANVTRTLSLNFFISEEEYARLHKKHIENGHYKFMRPLIIDILSGKISEKVKIIG